MRPFDAMMEGDDSAALLLRHILVAIEVAFPHADVMIEPDDSSNSIIFFIRKHRTTVEVTEQFLDADEGLNHALDCLAGLRPYLHQLKAGDVLMVTNDGVRMLPSN